MRILLTGGGTGGHIYPALAVARRLKEIETNVSLLYVGTERGLESTIVPKKDIPFQTIHIEGFKRGFDFESIKYNLKSLKLFFTSIHESKKIIREFKPDVVLGTGGYVSAPIGYAAAKEDIPTVVHEQNSFLGLTNRFLIRFIDRLAISFDEIYDQVEGYEEKIVFTGNPRAQEVAGGEIALVDQMYGLDVSKPIVLIFGGSRGAPKINQAVVEAYPKLIQKNYQIIFVPGETHYAEIRKRLDVFSPLKDNPQFVMKPYIHNMVEVLRHTSTIVSRSGATTIAEITSLGIPSVLIPSPNVTDDHQTQNAMSLVKHEAAMLLPEDQLTGASLFEKLNQLMENDEKREAMRERSRVIGQPQATDQLIQVMLDEMKKRENT